MNEQTNKVKQYNKQKTKQHSVTKYIDVTVDISCFATILTLDFGLWHFMEQCIWQEKKSTNQPNSPSKWMSKKHLNTDKEESLHDVLTF